MKFNFRVESTEIIIESTTKHIVFRFLKKIGFLCQIFSVYLRKNVNSISYNDQGEEWVRRGRPKRGHARLRVLERFFIKTNILIKKYGFCRSSLNLSIGIIKEYSWQPKIREKWVWNSLPNAYGSWKRLLLSTHFFLLLNYKNLSWGKKLNKYSLWFDKHGGINTCY